MEATYAPSFSSYRKRLYGAIPLLLIIGFVDYFRLRQPLPIYLAEFGGLIVLAAAYTYLYFRYTRVEVDKRSLTRRNAFGHRRVFADDELAAVVIVNEYSYGGGSGVTAPRLFVLDPEGRAILRWDGRYWPMPEMDALSENLGVPLTTLESSSSKTFSKEYPRALASIEVHPIKWALGLSAAILVVVVVVVFSVVGVPTA